MWPVVAHWLRKDFVWMPLLALAAILAAYTTGYFDGRKAGIETERRAWVGRITQAQAEAARTSTELQQLANQQARVYEQRIEELNRRSRNGMAKLHRELESLRGVCRVPDGVVRVFNDTTHPHLPRAAAPAAEPGGAATGIDAAEFVEHTYRNYTEVCQHNAEQVRALQEFYEQQRARFNKPR